MTTVKVDSRGLRAALVFAAARFRHEVDRLNSLDSAVGDGDHGTTVRIGFEAIQSALEDIGANSQPGPMLREAGTAFLSATGGAIGVIFGRALMAAGKALSGITEIGPSDFQVMLQAMENSIVSVGKAQPGDKTVLDAVHAAARIQPRETLIETVRAGAEAATQAAQNTAGLLCKVGRASRLGERAVGHPDPGAVFFGLFLEAVAESLERRPEH
jgi:dihydroxyacetone kinase-like protein